MKRYFLILFLFKFSIITFSQSKKELKTQIEDLNITINALQSLNSLKQSNINEELKAKRYKIQSDIKRTRNSKSSMLGGIDNLEKEIKKLIKKEEIYDSLNNVHNELLEENVVLEKKIESMRSDISDLTINKINQNFAPIYNVYLNNTDIDIKDYSLTLSQVGLAVTKETYQKIIKFYTESSFYRSNGTTLDVSDLSDQMFSIPTEYCPGLKIDSSRIISSVKVGEITEITFVNNETRYYSRSSDFYFVNDNEEIQIYHNTGKISNALTYTYTYTYTDTDNYIRKVYGLTGDGRDLDKQFENLNVCPSITGVPRYTVSGYIKIGKLNK